MGTRPTSAWSAGVSSAQTHDRSGLPPFPVLCPGAPRCWTAPGLRLWCADGTSSAQWTICVLSLRLLRLRWEEARKGRWARGGHAYPQALLLPGRHRGSVEGKIPVPLRILLSTRLLHMKEATDRFMRDTKRCCHDAQRFLLLHHTMQHGRPQGSGKTVCRLLWPWPPLLDHWEMP